MSLNIVDLITSNANLFKILIAVCIFIGSNVINTAVTSYFNNKKHIDAFDKTVSLPALKTLHPIFNSLKYYRDVKVPTCKIGGPVRTIIFQDCLSIYYTELYKICEELINLDITNDNFIFTNQNMIIAFNERLARALKEKGIPDIVIIKFQEWRSQRDEYAMNSLVDIHASSVINSLIEKEFVALTVFKELAYFTLIDAEKTLTELNGELAGVIYNNMQIEPLHQEEDVDEQ